MSRVTSWRGHAWIALPVRLYLAWVFVSACWHKIALPQSFAVDVATYQFLPLWSVNAFAIALPWIELFAGVMLLVGLRVRAAALLVNGMMVAFIIALVGALQKNLDISCGCFASQGAVEDPISWKTLVRDGFWLLLGLYVMVFDRRPLGLDRWLGPPEARARNERPTG